MRILATADLHYDIARSVAPTERLAAEVRSTAADALLIVGDACGRDLGILRRCLALFDGFAGRTFFVAGNHDLWTPDGDSYERYEHGIADVCREAGVWYLDAEPYVQDEIALVGSVGWYDYTFRQVSLGIPDRFYEHKIAPGAAARLAEYQHLVRDCDDLAPPLLEIGTRWMDGVHVRLPFGDADFTQLLLDKLRRHLEQAAGQARHILVAMHHLPFLDMVHQSGHPGWDFANAFMGSMRFGDLLLSFPQVRSVVCGHSHRPFRSRQGHIECINIGCTYRDKHFLTIDLP